MELKHDKAAFNAAYDALNDAQKKAVDSIEGPVMVIAGPGTGKTQILTLRIAQILLKTDTRPENILALTFTESGASAMRERLLRYIGTDAYRVGIFTFHAFAQQLIVQYPDAYIRIIGGRPATDIEKLSYIETIIDAGEIKLLRPIGDPRYYVSAIERAIASLKQEYITPDGFAEIIGHQEEDLMQIEKFHQKGAHKGKVRSEYQKKEKNIEKNRELLHVYRRYEALMREDRLYDFNDMIIETITALENNEDMLRDLQEQYQYVLADEHQDVNGSQNRILELITSFHEHPNIFVVGDEKQAIYRFQGASLENFLYFEDSFADVASISLTDNYRSGQRVLDAAHSLIYIEDGPSASLRIPLRSATEIDASVSLRAFSHELMEDQWLIKEIQKQITAGIPSEEIAIIVRTNREVEAFASLLRKEHIAVEATADSDVLKHPITQSVQALLQALADSSSESALATVLHGSYWGIPADDLFRILGACNYARSLMSIISDKEVLEEIGVVNIDNVLQVHATLEKGRALELTKTPQQVLEYVLQESGFLAAVLAQDSLEASRVVRRLYDEIEDMVLHTDSTTLRDVYEAFALREQYGLPLNAPSMSQHTHAVQVMTAHKSKGLEFVSVFIPHVVDSVWGNRTKRTYFDIPLLKNLKLDELDALDDERRLLYVALTRAKQQVQLSYSNTNSEGRSFVPSRLLSEIDSSLIQEESTEAFEASCSILEPLTKTETTFSLGKDFLTQVLQERGLSATSLNNYLASPWDYIYSNVLRIPEIQSESLQFGTVMHAALQRITAYRSLHQTLPNDSDIKEYLERALLRQPINKEQYVRLHEKGFAALIAYVHHMELTFPPTTKEEFNIRVFLPTGLAELPELPLTGKLDRLDLDADGRLIQVVDYKTGKPKSRNQIEGNTKGSDGNYKRQLTFYALLLSLYDDDRYTATTGLLSFVEPDTKGVIKEEVFDITKEEIEALKVQIIGVAAEIMSGSFLREPYEGETSRYGTLVHLLQGREEKDDEQ